MKKICVIGPSKKYFSGVTAYTICLANALAQSGPVSALTIRNLLPRFLYPGNRNVGRQDYSQEFSPEVPVFEGMDWNSPLSWYRAYRFLRREKPDVIIMAWWTSAVAHMELFVALANACCIKAKLILELHEIIDPLEAKNSLLKVYSRVMGRWIMNRAAAFIVHGEPVRETAIRAYKLPAGKVHVIPMGVDENSYYQPGSRTAARREFGIGEEFVILYFGMIRKYKGVPFLVKAFDTLPEDVARSCRLMIVGENWGDDEDLEPAIRNSKYPRRITYRPEFVPDARVPVYFAAADVVVLPYLRTAGSAVASLAMAFGKPIIISDLESLKGALEEYRGVHFVPTGDSGAIATRIQAEIKRYQAGQNESYTVPGACSWETITGRLRAVIKQL